MSNYSALNEIDNCDIQVLRTVQVKCSQEKTCPKMSLTQVTFKKLDAYKNSAAMTSATADAFQQICQN